MSPTFPASSTAQSLKHNWLLIYVAEPIDTYFPQCYIWWAFNNSLKVTNNIFLKNHWLHIFLVQWNPMHFSQLPLILDLVFCKQIWKTSYLLVYVSPCFLSNLSSIKYHSEQNVKHVLLDHLKANLQSISIEISEGFWVVRITEKEWTSTLSTWHIVGAQ